MRYVKRPTHQRGAQIVEYALLVAVGSIGLVLALPALGNGVCEVNNRVGSFFGAAPFACAAGASNNGGVNNNGANNNGGGNNPGGGTNPGKGNGNGGAGNGKGKG